jgi:hypothetical protein
MIEEHFATYAEDFNTCTLPDSRYYDLDKWEAEMAKKVAKEAKKGRIHDAGNDFHGLQLRIAFLFCRFTSVDNNCTLLDHTVALQQGVCGSGVSVW